MSLIKATEVMCDGCSEWERLEINMKHDWPLLRKEGWTRKEGKHFCPNCTGE